MSGPRRILDELKQRGVLRTASVYAVGAWLVIQIVDTTFPHLDMPAWSVTAVILLAILGLPVAIGLSWAFDVRPAGPVGTTPAEPEGASGGIPRTRLLIVLGIVLLATTAAGILIRRYMPPPIREYEVLVLPFQVNGSSEIAYLGEGLVDLVARNLEGVAGLHAADPHTAIRLANATDASRLIGVEQGTRLARQAGARLFILGTVTEHAGRLALTARLYDTRSPLEQPEPSTVEGDVGSLFELADRLTSELVVRRFGAASAQLARSAARATSSAEALRHFLRAEQALRGARYDSAVAGFQRAVAQDTAFALAYYRLAVAAVLNHAPDVARDAIAHARLHSSNLGSRDRQLLDAFADVHAGRANEAESAYRRMLDRYPDDLEARVQLGGLLALYNPVRGRPAAEAIPHLDRVGRLDPAYICPLCTVVNLELSERDVATADSLMKLRYPGSPLTTYHAGIAAARGDSAQLSSLVATMPTPAFWQASWAAAFFSSYQGALQLLSAPAVHALTGRRRVLAHLTVADLRVATLQWGAAMQEIRQAERISPRRAMLRRAYLTLLPFVERAPDDVDAVRAEVESWLPSAEHAHTEEMMLAEHLPCMRALLLGLSHARLGNDSAALDQADRLHEIAASSEATTLAHDLARTIRADLALRRDDPGLALAVLDSMNAEVPIAVMDAVAAGPGRDEMADLLTFDHARFLRVVALLRTGRAEEALRWAEHGFFRIGGNPLYAPAIGLARAEAYEAVGMPQRARELYAEYLNTTSRSDPDLSAAPARVRERIARLIDAAADR